MALAIFASSDLRMAGKHTRFMYHSVGYGAGGQIQDHIDSLKEADVLQRMYNSVFKDTGITKEMMKEIKGGKKDYFFSAKKAVELKIADDIIRDAEKEVQFIPQEEIEQALEQSLNKRVEIDEARELAQKIVHWVTEM